jgi:WD40 repeat protein
VEGAPDRGEAAGLPALTAPDVFISYAREDGEFVRRIHQRLVERGHEVWVDFEGIPPSAEWLEEIERGIEASSTFVFVISPDSVGSQICRQEIDHAGALGKRIIPVLWRPIAEGALPETVASHNWISFTEADDFEQRLADLFTAIETDLDWVREHTKWLLEAQAWVKRDRDSSLLLRGVQLREAESWLSEAAGAEKDPPPTPLQFEHVAASRRAATRRQRIVTALVAAALLVSLGLAAVALLERGHALTQEKRSRSREDASNALLNLSSDPELSVLLAREAMRVSRTAEAIGALRRALVASHIRRTYRLGQQVFSVSVSPDGGRILAGADRGRALLWDARSGKLVATLRGHTQPVLGTAFAADGKRALTFAQDGTARVWDAKTGRHVATIVDNPDNTGRLAAAAIDPAGRRVATVAFPFPKVHVWDAASGASLGVLDAAHGTLVEGIAFSPDGSLLAAATQGGFIQVWTTTTPTRTWVLGPTREYVDSVAFSRDGRLLLDVESTNAGEDGLARLWDVASRHSIGIYGSATSTVAVAALDPNGTLVATGSRDGSVRLWPVKGGTAPPLVGHPAAIDAIAFSPDGTHLLTGSDDSSARVWDVTSGALASELLGHKSAVRAAAFTPDGARVVTASFDGTVRVWDPGLNRAVRQLPLKDVSKARQTPAGPIALATVSASLEKPVAMVAEWDPRNGRVVGRVRVPNADDVGATPDGRNVLAYGQNTVSVWDVGGGRITTFVDRRQVRGQKPFLATAAVSADGRYVAYGEAARRAWVDIWRLSDRKRVRSVRLPYSAALLAFSPDGDRLAVMGDKASGQILAVAGGPAVQIAGKPTNEGVTNQNSLQFSPDGKRVLVMADDGVVREYDAATGKPVFAVHVFNAYFGMLQGSKARFNADGTRILTFAPWSEAAFVLNGATGATVATLAGHATGIYDGTWSPDGQYVLTVSGDRTARIWDPVTGDALDVARIATRGLSQALFPPGSNGLFVVNGYFDGKATLNAYRCEVCVSPDRLLALASTRATRPLSAAERARYHIAK